MRVSDTPLVGAGIPHMVEEASQTVMTLTRCTQAASVAFFLSPFWTGGKRVGVPRTNFQQPPFSTYTDILKEVGMGYNRERQ